MRTTWGWDGDSPTKKMADWSNSDLAEVYCRLLEAGVDFVVVGGQAVNLWSQHYRPAGTEPEAAWLELEPFTSRDLDCLGGSVDAAEAARALSAEVAFYDPFSRAWTPNSGTLTVPIAERELTIHFLHTVYGANRDEVRRTARAIPWDGKELRVMHPLVCLESKVDCLLGLDQAGRQDLKHVKLSCLVTRAFLHSRIDGATRDVLDAVERVMRLGTSEAGLRVWLQFAVECESALPISAIEAAASANEKLANFLRLRWPQLQLKLKQRRAHYREIFSRKP